MNLQERLTFVSWILELDPTSTFWRQILEGLFRHPDFYYFRLQYKHDLGVSVKFKTDSQHTYTLNVPKTL